MEPPVVRTRRFPQRLLRVLGALGLLLVLANVAWDRSSIGRSRAIRQSYLREADSFSSLWLAAGAQYARGIVLPLLDATATIGMSLVLELRTMDVGLPIEIPHCGDLGPTYQALLMREDPLLRVYDACELAVHVKTDQGEPRFCKSLEQCHKLFRSVDIKVLALLFSRFQQVMLVDADTLFFQSPLPLWSTHKFNSTGTLFFHDHVCSDTHYLAEMLPRVSPPVTAFQQFLGDFNVTPFQLLGVVPRPLSAEASVAKAPVKLPFNPSEFLLSSHAWNRRTGHEMDSSLVLWDKWRQPRATAILASFVSLNGPGRPPGFGVNELFFTACELAETAYAFADFGIGSIGPDKKTLPDRKTEQDALILCGDGLQYFPVATEGMGGGPGKLLQSEDSPLYLNGGNFISNWRPNEQPMFRSKARSAEFYPGSFAEHGIPQSCPFNVTIQPLTPVEAHRILQRQKMHTMVVEWLSTATQLRM